jgi:Sec-independent protein secretion pathway component TatC
MRHLLTHLDAISLKLTAATVLVFIPVGFVQFIGLLAALTTIAYNTYKFIKDIKKK